jgi:hypothetical protein
LFSWIAVLYAFSQDAAWTQEETRNYAIITAAFGACQLWNLQWLMRWRKSSIKAWLIASPLYLIKTHIDTVWYWPIWEIESVNATHNYRNGIYQGTDVRMKFKADHHHFSLGSQNAYNELL